MKKLILTWAILRLIWESKGYSMKEMPGLLQGRWPGRKGLAFTSIQRKAQRGKRAPSDIARFVMDAELLPVREGQEKPAEIVRLGLLALRGQPMPNRALHELAPALLAHFPMDEFALKLAEELAKRTAGKGSPMGRLARRMARLMAKRLAQGDPAMNGKLDALAAKVERGTWEILRAVRGSGAFAGGFAGGIVVLVAVVLVNCQHAPTSAARRAPEVGGAPEVASITSQPVIIGVSMVQGGTPVVFDIQALLGAVTGQMGEKTPPEQYTSNGPLPGQKAPPCNDRLYEVSISGGCWAVIGNAKPPCGLLFRQGDTCYRPVAADPQKPVMVTPRAPGQGSH